MKLFKTPRRDEQGFTITGAVVGLAIAGIAMTAVGHVMTSLAKTQAKTLNFGRAEASATVYAAQAAARFELPELPDTCELDDLGDLVYKITCTNGTVPGTIAKATRAFDIIDESAYQAPDDGPKRKEGPYTPGVFCPPWDPDGTLSYDNDHNVVCNPNYPN